MPKSIKVLLALVISTFFIDQFSSFYDTHWQVAELSFADPIYLAMTIMWFCIVVWICHNVVKRKKHVPSTLGLLTVVVAIFMGFEYMEGDSDISLVVSFQFLELACWAAAFFVAKYEVESGWFDR